MILHALRGLTLVLVAAISALYLLSNQETGGIGFAGFTVMLLIAVGVAAVVIATDMAFRAKRLSSISGVFLGLIVGLIVAWPGWIIIDLVADITAPQVTVPLPKATEIYAGNSGQAIAASNQEEADPPDAPQDSPAGDSSLDETDEPLDSGPTSSAVQVQLKLQIEDHNEQVAQRAAYFALFRGVKVILGIITCYISISLVLQTKDDFRFVIPYVEFAKQIRGNRPTILDTSVVIDGRIIEIINTRIIQGTLILPRFMLNELQLVADAGDRIKRTRGRRGLDMLQKLQATSHVEVIIDDTEVEGTGVDQKLVSLAEEKRARLLTLDFNLNKVATLRGIDVINLNDLVAALKPVALPGEPLHVTVTKPGEGNNQGVGYLDDGTMVVIENGRPHIGHMVEAEVTRTLQTSAGRMIFARYLHEDDATPGSGSEQSETNPQKGDDEQDPGNDLTPPNPPNPAPTAPTDDSAGTEPHAHPQQDNAKRGKRGGRNPRRHGR